MQTDRLARQIAFIVEIDKLKTILRRTPLTDESRRENSAEHSWHLAVMAVLLAEYADEPVDAAHAVKLVLIHDIIEIDAGDTFAYDVQGYLDKEEREQRAAERLFALLPDDQASELLALWREFEDMETPESRFANAMDRLQPTLMNHNAHGGTWRENGVTQAQIERRDAPIGAISSALGDLVQEIIQTNIERGYINTGAKA
jgi:putative hydrolase of HD superfamily